MQLSKKKRVTWNNILAQGQIKLVQEVLCVEYFEDGLNGNVIKNYHCSLPQYCVPEREVNVFKWGFSKLSWTLREVLIQKLNTNLKNVFWSNFKKEESDCELFVSENMKNIEVNIMVFFFCVNQYFNEYRVILCIFFVIPNLPFLLFFYFVVCIYWFVPVIA